MVDLGGPSGEGVGRDAAGRPDRRRALLSAAPAGDRGLPRRVALLRAPGSPRRPTSSRRSSPTCRPPAMAPAAAPGRSDRAVRILLRGRRRSLVLDALAGARAGRAAPARLLLLGAPGPSSPAARRWRRGGAAARRSTVAGLLRDALGPGALDALAGCDLLLVVNDGGADLAQGDPGRLAGLGRPVVAIDGPRTLVRAPWTGRRSGSPVRTPAALAAVAADCLPTVSWPGDRAPWAGVRGDDHMGVSGGHAPRRSARSARPPRGCPLSRTASGSAGPAPGAPGRALVGVERSP